MALRRIQKIPVFPVVVLSHPVEDVDEDGFVTIRNESDIQPLPPPENFNLENMLRAGVDIRSVPTKSLGSGAAVADVIEKASKQPSKKES